jgi:hypothetical protein
MHRVDMTELILARVLISTEWDETIHVLRLWRGYAGILLLNLVVCKDSVL